MKGDFWLKRWQDNQIAFNLAKPHPSLCHYMEQLIGTHKNVLVPLCGKAHCLHWLQQHQQTVTGIELVQCAVEQFFAEADYTAYIIQQQSGSLTGYHYQNLSVYQGDYFAYSSTTPFNALYDRAAYIAFPDDMRVAYIEKTYKLLADGATGMLITLEYDSEGNGPPFSLSVEETIAEWQPLFAVEHISTIPCNNTPSGQGFEHVFFLKKQH